MKRSTLKAGRVLHSSYQILRCIEAGGMGVVYEAAHLRLRGRRLAVKVLPREMADDEQLYQRFQREAEILAGLDHPHIVQVQDFNRTDDGYPYLVMEYLEGQDLQAKLKEQGLLSPSELALLIRQLGDALQYAHDHNVVHRDLKPQNVFLCRSSRGALHAKLLDFGISKHLVNDRQLTRTEGMIIGTAAFMSPEQADGRIADIDARSDIFSLGTLVFGCLTGELPFDGPTDNDIRYRISKAEPTPLSQYLPAAPAALDAVLARAFQKRREERFQRIDAMADAVVLALGALPEGALIPSGQEAVLRWASGAPSINQEEEEAGIPELIPESDESDEVQDLEAIDETWAEDEGNPTLVQATVPAAINRENADLDDLPTIPGSMRPGDRAGTNPRAREPNEQVVVISSASTGSEGQALHAEPSILGPKGSAPSPRPAEGWSMHVGVPVQRLPSSGSPPVVRTPVPSRQTPPPRTPLPGRGPVPALARRLSPLPRAMTPSPIGPPASTLPASTPRPRPGPPPMPVDAAPSSGPPDLPAPTRQAELDGVARGPVFSTEPSPSPLLPTDGSTETLARPPRSSMVPILWGITAGAVLGALAYMILPMVLRSRPDPEAGPSASRAREAGPERMGRGPDGSSEGAPSARQVIEVRILGLPEDAKVFIDDELRYDNPLKLERTDGFRALRIEHPRYGIIRAMLRTEKDRVIPWQRLLPDGQARTGEDDLVPRDRLLRRGQRAVASGDAETAQALAEELLKRDRGDAEALLLAGKAACMSGDRDKARQLWEQLDGRLGPDLLTLCKALGIIW